MTVAGTRRGLVRHRRFRLADAVVREVVEETGLVCRAVQLLALFDKLSIPIPAFAHAHKAASFLCEVTGRSGLPTPMKPRGRGTSPSTPCPNSPPPGGGVPGCTLHDHLSRGGDALFD